MIFTSKCGHGKQCPPFSRHPGIKRAGNLFQDFLLDGAAGGRLVFSFESSGQMIGQMKCYLCGSSISSFIFIKPYFSYKGRPISVASKEIAVIPLLLVSLTSLSNVL